MVALLAVTAAYVITRPNRDLAAGGRVLGGMPGQLGAWDGTELSFDDATLEYLDSDDLLVRRYERGDDVVWLTIIYHQNQRYGAHDPLVCYQSAGYAVLDHAPRRLAAGESSGQEVSRFVARRPRGQRLVYYWWTTAGLTTTDAMEFRRRLAFSGMLENASWGAFVRVETPIDEGAVDVAEGRLQDFAAEVARALPGVLGRAGLTTEGRRGRSGANPVVP